MISNRLDKNVHGKDPKSTSPKGKKRPPVILFGNHLALFLPSFWPVIHLVTTKNWAKLGLFSQTMSNDFKPFRRKNPRKPMVSGDFEHF